MRLVEILSYEDNYELILREIMGQTPLTITDAVIICQNWAPISLGRLIVYSAR